MNLILNEIKYGILLIMKFLCKFSVFACLLFGFFSCGNSRQATWLSMINGNTIDGSQLLVNNFGESGQMGGFTSGSYFYKLTRSGGFKTVNLGFTVNGTALFENTNIFLTNNVYTIALDGIIPYGTECGATENITMKFYNLAGQEVLSNTFIIRNPLQPIPVSKFKIFGSTVGAPTLIQGCESKSANILLNNIELQYLGTGLVQKYRVIIEQATSTGAPLTAGFQFTQNWVLSVVPPTLYLNTLIGQTIGIPPNTWTYFLVTLETVGGPCSGGAGIHKALVLLSPQFCPK